MSEKAKRTRCPLCEKARRAIQEVGRRFVVCNDCHGREVRRRGTGFTTLVQALAAIGAERPNDLATLISVFAVQAAHSEPDDFPRADDVLSTALLDYQREGRRLTKKVFGILAESRKLQETLVRVPVLPDFSWYTAAVFQHAIDIARAIRTGSPHPPAPRPTSVFLGPPPPPPSPPSPPTRADLHPAKEAAARAYLRLRKKGTTWQEAARKVLPVSPFRTAEALRSFASRCITKDPRFLNATEPPALQPAARTVPSERGGAKPRKRR